MTLTEPQRKEYSAIQRELRAKGVAVSMRERITREEVTGICDDYGIKHPHFLERRTWIIDVISYIVVRGARAITAVNEIKTCPWCNEPAIAAVWTPRHGWLDLCQRHYMETSQVVISHLRHQLTAKETA